MPATHSHSGHRIRQFFAPCGKASVGWRLTPGVALATYDCQRHGRVLDSEHGPKGKSTTSRVALSGFWNPCSYTGLPVNNSPLSERQCLNTVPPYIDCPSTLDTPRDAGRRFRTHSQNTSPDGPPKENGGLLGSGRVGVQRTIHCRRGRQAPAPTQLGGWMNPMGSDGARNPCNLEPSGYENACDIPTLSVDLPTNYNRLNHQPQDTETAARPLHSEQQKGGWQPGESGVPRTTQSRRCRRQVLHPTHSIGQLAIRETWSGGQNLTDWYTVGTKTSCGVHLPSVDSPTAAHSHARSQEVGR